MIKSLARSIREYKKTSFLAMAYVAVEVLFEVVIPLLMAFLIDEGIEKNDMSVILKSGIILLVFAIISMLSGILAGKYASIASCGFAKNLREDMFSSILAFSSSNKDKYKNAGIITRLTHDVTHMQMAYQMIIRTLVRSPAMFIFSFAAAFLINQKLALTFMIFVPVLAIGLYLIMRKAHPNFRKVFKTYDELNNVVEENLRGMHVVKSFTREELEEEKFEKTSSAIEKLFKKAEGYTAFNMPLMQFCMYSLCLIISWLGAKQIIACQNTTFTTGELMSLVAYAIQILNSLMMISMVFVMITISRAAAERIVEVLEEIPDIKNPEHKITEVKNGDIKFENVYFSYEKNHKENYVLNNINLYIKSGQTIGIIGSTGSSKSSLISLIPRLYDASQGRVLVGGEDVRRYDIKTLRDAVSVVLQKNTLFSGTVRENLRWGDKNATDEQIKTACKLAQADAFINEMPKGYDSFIEQGGANLSGGQRQRLCIARALVKNPKILILDDSTSAVDTKTDKLIREAFLAYIPDTTKIIIAQRVNMVKDADQIIVMENGKIDAVGTHEELYGKNEIYTSVYNTQQQGGGKND